MLYFDPLNLFDCHIILHFFPNSECNSGPLLPWEYAEYMCSGTAALCALDSPSSVNTHRLRIDCCWSCETYDILQ